jgi:hypothetical protein
LKPRLWTDKQIGTILGNGAPFGVGPLFDLTPDGRRIIAWDARTAKGSQSDLQLTMLLNWFDELRRRLPPSGK